ncbi:hypothetical protein KZX46_04350 [Polymorphobacter sp. PAMC 29334]|uniref:hypothetical protein n=1 Tax=Polymorphobacter sp. PAMC 29334 TaxID=2862331 RepID=UPI001C7788D5|nr:hypothetical protein [Polymorphobacter sp. PAMC 29334]QYE35238.1 hypothetical protein KZX46_04350 [Polymorphobacter sp. PAMC 29334]
MTTLLSWVSFSDADIIPHKPRAVYLASDSRITWDTADHRWDSGRKIFAPTTAPHLFGFVGDVVLPGLILGQVSAAIDAGILIDPQATPDEQHQAVLGAIQRAVATTVATPSLDFTIHHLMRSGDWPNTEFRAWQIGHEVAQRRCTSSPIAVPATTALIKSFGSGGDAADEHRTKWLRSDVGSRSRAILSAFHDAIVSGDDLFSGGPPQLAALYTRGPPVPIGLVVGEHRYLNGLQVDVSPLLDAIEWRDRLGQRVEPTTGSVKPGARRFVRPGQV